MQHQRHVLAGQDQGLPRQIRQLRVVHLTPAARPTACGPARLAASACPAGPQGTEPRAAGQCPTRACNTPPACPSARSGVPAGRDRARSNSRTAVIQPMVLPAGNGGSRVAGGEHHLLPSDHQVARPGDLPRDSSRGTAMPPPRASRSACGFPEGADELSNAARYMSGLSIWRKSTQSRDATNGGNATLSSSTGTSRCVSRSPRPWRRQTPPATAPSPPRRRTPQAPPLGWRPGRPADAGTAGPRRRCPTRRRTPPTPTVQVPGQYPHPLGVLGGVRDEHVPAACTRIAGLRHVHPQPALLTPGHPAEPGDGGMTIPPPGPAGRPAAGRARHGPAGRTRPGTPHRC